MSEKTIRAFIALDLDETAHAQLTQALEAYKANLPTEIRFILPENYHLTLAFLGQIHPEILPILKQGLEEITQGLQPFRICLTELTYFPNQHYPKVLAAMIYPAPELISSQQAVSAVLKKLEIPEAVHDQFLPHLSVAYCNRMKSAINAIPKMPLDITSMINAIVVYQSHTESSGVVYEPLTQLFFR